MESSEVNDNAAPTTIPAAEFSILEAIVDQHPDVRYLSFVYTGVFNVRLLHALAFSK